PRPRQPIALQHPVHRPSTLVFTWKPRPLGLLAIGTPSASSNGALLPQRPLRSRCSPRTYLSVSAAVRSTSSAADCRRCSLDAALVALTRRGRSRHPASPPRVPSAPVVDLAALEQKLVICRAAADLVSYCNQVQVDVKQVVEATPLLQSSAPAAPPHPSPPSRSRRPDYEQVAEAHLPVEQLEVKIEANIAAAKEWNALCPRFRRLADPSFAVEKLLALKSDAQHLAFARANYHARGIANDSRNHTVHCAWFALGLPAARALLARHRGLEKFKKLKSLRGQRNDWLLACCRRALPLLHDFLQATLARFLADPEVYLDELEFAALSACLREPRYTRRDDRSGVFTFAAVDVDRSPLEPLCRRERPPPVPPPPPPARPAVDADGDLDLVGASTSRTAASGPATAPRFTASRAARAAHVVDEDGDIDLVDATAVDVDVDSAVFPVTTARDSTGDLLLAVAAKARELADASEDSSSHRSSSLSSPPRAAVTTRAGDADHRVESDHRRERYNRPPPLVAPVVPPPPPPPAHEPGDTQLSLLAYWGHLDDRPRSASATRSPATDSVSSIGRGLTGLSVRSPSATSSVADSHSPERRLYRNPSPPPDTEPPAGSSS
ncbi:hypothetical protein HDU96_003009, partial [Phlyctochytrium bullatum]